MDILTHRIRYHLKALFALVTIVWDPGWYDLHRVEYSTECIQFGRCFLGAFRFYAADVGCTKLSVYHCVQLKRAFDWYNKSWVKAIFHVNETQTSWIMKFWSRGKINFESSLDTNHNGTWSKLTWSWKLSSHWSQWYESQPHMTIVEWNTSRNESNYN